MTTTGVHIIEDFVKTLDDKPGVYRMLDENDKPLYIGKAKRLRRRVDNYTKVQPNARLTRMVSKTARMLAITTNTENEALLLEQQLIKENNPPFNVRLKDGRSYPGILLSTSHPYPQLRKHRGRPKKKDTLFGPFADGKAVEHATRQLQRLFLLRTCDDASFQSRTRPCLLHQIHKCTAPCVGKVTQEDYTTQVQDAIHFLNGKRQDIVQRMQTDMQTAAQEERFEDAARLRDRLKALTQVQENQTMALSGVDNADIIGIHQEGPNACVQVMFLRSGQMRGNSEHHLNGLNDLEPSDIIEAFLPQFYTTTPPAPLVLLSDSPRDPDWIADSLTQSNGHKVVIAAPQKGERKTAVLNAARNAKDAFMRRQASNRAWAENMDKLAEFADLKKLDTVEVYDNSHIQGAHALGVAVVAGRDGFQKSHYRKYNFDADSGVAGNDVGMMELMLYRRFKRMKENSETLPDLLLIDGGITQLRAALAALKKLSLNIPCVGVAKGEDRNAGKELLHHPDGRITALGHTDPTLYFIQRLRDEAHRFAITSHRNRRQKAQNKGPLDDIPGLGQARKSALIRRFGSQKAAAAASVSELASVNGISQKLAQTIKDSLA